MNLLQQANRLKEMSDQQLPMLRGRVPEYLLVAELQRRDDMRKAHQKDMALAGRSESAGTVSDDLWNTVMPQQQMMAPPMQQQQQMPPQPPPQPPMPMSVGGLVQRLRQGGMVRYAEGGRANPARSLADLAAMRGPQPSWQEAMQQAQAGYGPDALAPILAELAAQKATPVVNKPSIWTALMQSGAGMMASRNLAPLGGIGEGIQQGIAGYMQDRDRFQQDRVRMQEQAMRNLGARANIAEGQNRRTAGIAGLAGDIQSRAAAQGDRNVQALQQAELNALDHQQRMELEANRQAFDLPYRQSQIRYQESGITENEAQAAARRQTAAQQAALWESYMKRSGGDAAKAQIMMLRDKAQAEHIQPIARLNPIDEAVYSELRRQGLNAEEARNRMNSGRTMESERKAVANVLQIVDRDMREWKKDPMGGMRASKEEESQRRRELTMRLATQAGVLDLLMEREAKAGISGTSDAPPPSNFPKIKILSVK
jgi:hypothetical protein